MRQEQSAMPGKTEHWLTVELGTLVLVCAAYVFWTLSLPLFPTQDGPVHLYYVHVMQALFSKQPTPYANFYYIKHLLPPYSLYYYSLILLAKFVPILLADKLILCGYFVSFLFGFRYLARSIGPSADRMTLLVTLLLFNWPLVMGFVNFCLSITFGLWALGHWVRLVGRPGYARRGVFLLLTIIITLTHPVPLLFVLAFCAASLIVRFLQCRSHSDAKPMPPFFFQDLILFFLAGSVLGYVKLFTSAKVLQQTKPATSTLGAFVHHVHSLGIFGGTAWTVRIYLGLLISVLCVALLLACRSWWLNRRTRTADFKALWVFLAVAFVVALPFIPHDLNGSHYFSDRLPLFAWLAALLAASAYKPKWRAERPVLVLFVLCANLLTLYLAETNVRPVAKDIAAVQILSPLHHGRLGLALEDTEPDSTPNDYVAYNPYLWASVHNLRYNDAVLYNTPWLDLEIIPLGARPPLATPLSSTALEAPWLLVPELRDSPVEWASVLSRVDFAVVDVGAVKVPGAPSPALAESPDHASRWTCSVAPSTWFKICDRHTVKP